MIKSSSAETLALMARILERGEAIDISDPLRLRYADPTGKLPTVINGSEYMRSNSPQAMKEVTDARPPFEQTLVGFQIPVSDDKSVKLNERLAYITISHWSPGDTSMLMVVIGGFDAPDGTGFKVVVPTSTWSIEIDPSTGEIGEHYKTHSPAMQVIPKEERAQFLLDEEVSGEVTETEALIFLYTLSVFDLANCSNIEIAEPRRARPERRRLERLTETSISHLMIRKKGSRSAGGNRVVKADDSMLPLHTVRGHVAHYGDCCPGSHEPRGLLFGKNEGRVWVPSHARGDKRHGERLHEYEVEA